MSAPARSPHAKTIIIGSGPAGYTAAIYAARAMLEPLLIAGFEAGGQLMITTDVENYPGFAEAIQGPWLMEQMRAQAEHVGTHIISDHIVKVELGHHPFRLFGDSGEAYVCDTLVIATGAKAKWLNLPSEQKFKGYGVSACATCDGFFYRGKEVIVVGGGNSAVEEALYLSHLASKVTVVHRGSAFRAERILQDRLFKRANVGVIWDHVVDEIGGAEDPPRRHSRHPEERQNGGSAHASDAMAFSSQLATRRPPACSRASSTSSRMAISGRRRIRPRPASPASSRRATSTDDVFRQAVTAAGMGCMAALEAERWLAAENHKRIAAE